METLIIAGQITATSNKQDDKFKQEVPTKTVYIAFDEENGKKLEDFGIHTYTSQNKERFAIVKAPASGISIWNNGKNLGKMDCSIEAKNFKTVDGLPVGLAFVKGDKLGNEFYRITDINVGQETDIEYLEKENPFI